MTSLDLALVGNGTIGALVNREAEIVWLCFPGFDGDPVFCSLLQDSSAPRKRGVFAIDMIDGITSEQHYVADTPILVTRLLDANGGCIQVTDFCPRFQRGADMFAPMMLVRRIERIAGNPVMRVRMRPMEQYGAHHLAPQREPHAARGSDGNRLRFEGEHISLRLTSDAPLDAITEETPFTLDHAVTLLLGPDEDVDGEPAEVGQDLQERTGSWWCQWADSLTVPVEWRDEVVRAAITLKLNVSEKSGAIIAAMTTSIPESPDSGRNWDYRYCWLRDAYFVVDALYRVGDSATTARYIEFVKGIVAGAPAAPVAPMFTVAGGPIPAEREARHLPGYRGMGPVRVGNQAYLQIQHDAYGECILAAQPLFFESTLSGDGRINLFKLLESLGARAATLFDKPDAGLWELRETERVHTFSSVMCWAACDALSRIAAHLELEDRASYWRDCADEIHRVITDRSWNSRLGAFTAAMNGDTLDASLLLMHHLGFLAADDTRYVSTVRAIGRDLRRGEFVYRYVEKDDIGEPENAFLVCTFWYIDALASIGERAEARRLFEHVLSCRNRHGLLAEDVDPETREQWGNFVQTYSMAGIIGSAILLSDPVP